MSNCMEKYKSNFAISFAQIMGQNLSIWQEIQKQERKSLYSKPAIGGYLFSALLGFIPGKRETDYDLNFHCWAAVVMFFLAIIANIQMTNKSYQRAIKNTLFSHLLKIFGEDIKYQWGRISNLIYTDSMLFKKEVTAVDHDDYFGGKYNDVEFIIEETELMNIIRLKNGKSDKTEAFKGVAMMFKMNKRISSRVLIYSKSIFNKPPAGYEKVELEYPAFNKKYEVWVKKYNSTGQIEARYFLNLAFLERFMQIHTSFKTKNIKCSVCGDTLLILLSTKKDLFEMNHLFGRIDDPSQYKKLFDEFASVLSFIDVLNLASKTKL